MDVFPGSAALPRPLRDPVVAIGNFDGVHVGHQRLLALTLERARARGGQAVVYTFDPHPAKVLAPSLAPPLITPLQRKLELIAAHGMDVAVVEPFTQALASRSADQFVDDILVKALGVREVVVGHDFTFGRARAGTAAMLVDEGAQKGFRAHIVPAVAVEGLVVSSTKVRELLLEGNVVGARLLLGREFDVEGPVVAGAGRGKSIGIATANVAAETEILPRPGVYAVHATLLGGGGSDDAPRAAVANLGTNPTFVSGDRLSLEVHILDWDGDLYGRRLRVGFHSGLRGEKRFPSAAELVAQIRRDIDEARVRLGRPT